MVSTDRSDEFAEAIIASQRRLYAYILTMLPDSNEASDVLQQTNMAIWRDASRFVEGTNFIAWAFRIAYFKVLEHREKSNRSRLRFCESTLENLSRETESRLADEDEESRLTAMRQCVDQLPERHRELIHRRYYRGETVGSLAASTGKSANALANSLFRIRKALWNCIHRRLAKEQT